MIRRSVVMLFLCGLANGQIIFTPPLASHQVVMGVDFNGTPVGDNFRARFNECDTSDLCNGKPVSRALRCSTDRNRNTVLLKLKNNTLFYNAKMALDADGSPFAHSTPGVFDQDGTSLQYPGVPNTSLNSDRIPFIVIPKQDFAKSLNVQLGDVAAVVFGNKRVFAVVADQGPPCKIGEGSIQLHEAVGHSVCTQRAANGDCTKLRDVGIEKDVLYFIFSGTHTELMDGLTPENINARIDTIGTRSWESLTRH